MEKQRILLLTILSFTLILLAACGHTNDELSNKAESVKKDDPIENSNDVSTKANSNENATNTDSSMYNENGGLSTEEASTNEPSMSLKDQYFQKLNDTKKETDAMKPEDTSTYALKNVEGYKYDVWDELLNEVYGILKKQLSAEDMEHLRAEQLDWITYRDNTAKDASLKYKGGTMEHAEYVAVLAKLTEERCFELVEEYML